ncbi:MAG: hypothetical protein H6739_19625 [Alphaproteobacteria bacterium]|nr:hypothetical protein [Alphaproteobacteria bacterium]
MPLLLLLACTPNPLGPHLVADGQYWLFQPPGVPIEGAAVYVHLHPDGDGAGLADNDTLLDELTRQGLIAVFPDGGGDPGDDWNVGINKDDIPRDDTVFLANVAADLRDRWGAAVLWLGGSSKGGAMSYEMACLGEPVYDGYVPISGAIEAPLPHACTAPPAPIRHLQGTRDDRWPLHTADDPDSTHMGILDSLGELQASDDTCLEAEPTIEGDCQVWAGCPAEVRLCMYEGGHAMPSNWVELQVAGMQMLKQ